MESRPNKEGEVSPSPAKPAAFPATPSAGDTPATPPSTSPTFAPQTTGVFVLLVIVAAFAAGTIRRELALTLTGAVFLAVWAYCLLMTLLVALLHCRRATRLSITVSPQKTQAGETVAVHCSVDGAPAAGKISPFAFFTLPGIVIRCRLLLETKDGRRIQHDFAPGSTAPESVTANLRGAYFSAFKKQNPGGGVGCATDETRSFDEFAVFDIFGFFRFAWRIPAESGARLLVSPVAAEEPLPVNARAGESNYQAEFSFQRTDNLIDHRPYVPGDDPRRINWKLYGHGGELFVREGENEPPPHSNLIILVDSQFDPLLYSVEAARRGVDRLCENALAMATAAVEAGMDVLTGHTGGATLGGGGAAGSAIELSAAFALPAAQLLSSGGELPAPPDGRQVLLLALPRASAETSALEKFLQKRVTDTTIFFICGVGASADADRRRTEAAETCAALYRQRSGVRVHLY